MVVNTHWGRLFVVFRGGGGGALVSFTITLNAADRGEAMLFYDFFSSGECAVVGRVCSHREGVQLCGECAVRFGCVQSARRVCSEVFSEVGRVCS